MMAEIRRALVAGANGIIGKALMQELAAADGWHGRILGLREGGAGRVWIGEIRRDVPARSVRSTREGTRG
jgi:nucleoside-diphosphate-sugar epimerase